MNQKYTTGKLTGVVTSCVKGGSDNRYRCGVKTAAVKQIIYCDSWYSLKIGTTVVIAGKAEHE